MGISETVAPTSDQLDAVDLIQGPQTFTVTRVEYKAGAEQPIAIHFAEFPRPWKPGKNMRRVLMGVWGGDEQAYVGRRITLFCEPKVKYGGQEVGGTRPSHMSHIDNSISVPVIISKGKSAVYIVRPLIDTAQPAPQSNEPTAAQVADCTDQEVLGRMWQSSGAERRVEIEARVAELKALAEYDRQKEQDHLQAEGARAEGGT